MAPSLIVIAAIVVTCAREAVHWVGRPFAGLLFADNLIVVSIGSASWRDPQLRRTEWSQILGVDGAPVESSEALLRAISAHNPGDLVTYTLRRSGEVFRVAMPVRTFTWRDFREIFAPMLAVGTLLVLIGGALVMLRPGQRDLHALYALCVAIGVALITGPDQYGPYRFTPVYLMAIAAVSPAILHLAAVYPWRPAPWMRLAVVASYVAFALVGGLLVAVRHDPGAFLPLLYFVYVALANALILYAGSLLGALVTNRRSRLELAIALTAVLGSSGIAGLVLVAYPLMTEPIAPAWLLVPLLLMPILSGVAFLDVAGVGRTDRGRMP